MTNPSTSGAAQGAPAPWAAFVFAPAGGRGWAATTRAADRGEAGRVGLPGGKIDAGESVACALLREAAEEGWDVVGPFRAVHMAPVDGRPVLWVLAAGAVRRREWKERHRGIVPVALPLWAIAGSGYGNAEAVSALEALLRPVGGPRRWAAQWAGIARVFAGGGNGDESRSPRTS